VAGVANSPKPSRFGQSIQLLADNRNEEIRPIGVEAADDCGESTSSCKRYYIPWNTEAWFFVSEARGDQ